MTCTCITQLRAKPSNYNDMEEKTVSSIPAEAGALWLNDAKTEHGGHGSVHRTATVLFHDARADLGATLVVARHRAVWRYLSIPANYSKVAVMQRKTIHLLILI